MIREFLTLLLLIILTSCNRKEDEPNPVDPGGSGDTTSIEATLFPLPPVGYVGDVMPYYFNDEFHIFYLQDVRDGAAGYHPWDKFTTKDFLKYEYKGEMIPLGGEGDQDLAIGTGSVIKVGDTYYGYYTGHNWQFLGTGRAQQGVMYATSTDLENWVKKDGFNLRAAAGYEMNDFRDPLVLYNEENQEYMMLVSSRINGKGVLAHYTTQDLASDNWELQEPFYAPEKWDMLECADLFKWGNYWYLLFSDTGPEHATHYRIGTSMNGPWITPQNDVFDGEYFYAAKTTTDGQKRYLFAWISTKAGHTDLGKRDWAGNLAVHEMQQASDGTLSVKAPSNITEIFTKEVELAAKKTEGNVAQSENTFQLNSPGRLSYALFNNLKETYTITGTLSTGQTPDDFGFLFGTDGDINKTFRLGYDINKGLVCDNLNYGNAFTEAKIPFNLEPGKDYEVRLLIEGSVCVLYVDNKVALSTWKIG